MTRKRFQKLNMALLARKHLPKYLPVLRNDRYMPHENGSYQKDWNRVTRIFRGEICGVGVKK